MSVGLLVIFVMFIYLCNCGVFIQSCLQTEVEVLSWFLDQVCEYITTRIYLADIFGL